MTGAKRDLSAGGRRTLRLIAEVQDQQADEGPNLR